MFAEVPTLTECGFPRFDPSFWIGLAVPRATPAPVIARLNKAVNTALADAGVRKRLEHLNLDPRPGTPQEAAQMLRGDVARWRSVIAQAKIERQ